MVVTYKRSPIEPPDIHHWPRGPSSLERSLAAECDESGVERVGIEEAAKIAGIGRTLLYKIMKSGELKSFKIGKHRLVDRRDIDAWLEDKRNAAPTTFGRAWARYLNKQNTPRRPRTVDLLARLNQSLDAILAEIRSLGDRISRLESR